MDTILLPVLHKYWLITSVSWILAHYHAVYHRYWIISSARVA